MILITLAVYAPVRHFDFVQIDDPLMVADNPHLTGGLTWDNVRWAFSTDQIDYAKFWMPLVWLSYLVDVQLFGVAPGAMHVTNVVIHLASTLILFGVFARTTGRPWPSLFVAAMFALHPLHVESVAWVTERKDVLSALFWMLTMAAYAGYVRRPDRTRYAIVIVSFVLGLLVKPMLVTLPFALLLFDLWPLGRAWSRWLIVEKVPLLALTAAAGLVAIASQETGDVPFDLRMQNALVSYVEYLWKTIWPVRLTVNSDLREAIPALTLAVCAAVMLIVSVLALRLRRDRPYVFVGWVWYLGTLLPVIGLIQFSITPMADRFTYLPSIGLFAIAAWGVPDLIARWRVPALVAPVLAVAAIAASAVVSRTQVGYWRDNVTLFTRATEITLGVDTFTAHLRIGNTLRQQKRFDEAILHFNEAIALQPGSADARMSLAFALVQASRIPEAIRVLAEAARLNPDNAEVRRLLDQLSRRQEFR